LQTSADLDHHGALDLFEPGPTTHRLLLTSLLDPFPIVEHEDIGPGQPATMRAGWQSTEQLAVARIDLRDESASRPQRRRTWGQTLQVMDRPVTFIDAQGIETRLLEVPIDVASKNEGTVLRGLAPLAHHRKAWMRHSITIQG